jgi:hypothetical protein
MRTEAVVPIRGYLLHLTHYDPVWVRRKGREKPFDLSVGLEVVDGMADAGLNLLVIDCADGVKYRSHPELARRYTVPMSHLRQLVRRAQKRGIEIVPKLNFAQSALHEHNHWFRPYHRLFDNDEYWRRAFRLIDELTAVCAPPRFFHIGMDEDHDRSHAQYAAAIRTLRDGLRERALRAVMWKDAQLYAAAQVHAEKSRAGEDKIPKDVVQVVWHYGTVLTDVVRRLRQKGFEVWGAPGREPEKVRAWREAILRYGGTGLLLTHWIPCRPGNRTRLLRHIRTAGPVCSGG